MPFEAKWANRSGTPTYWSWTSMRTRCLDPKHTAYALYGGRGIKVCGRWRDDYDAFFADMGERPPGLTLERVDGNGHYEPSNCVWATPKQQSNNRRDNRHITFEGVTMTLAEWGSHFGLGRNILGGRLRRMPMELAMTPRRYKLRADMEHGTTSMYRTGCRCRPCTKAVVAAASERRRKRKARQAAGEDLV
jgi:hypothetical protein